NAFLKTLEEPPPDTYFVLVTHAPNRLISTIISRCLTIRFPELPKEKIEKVCELENISGLHRELALKTGAFLFLSVSEEKLKEMAHLADAVIKKRSLDLIFEVNRLTKGKKEPDKKNFHLFLLLLREKLNEYLKKGTHPELFKLHEVLSFVEESVYNYNLSLRSLFEYLIVKGDLA
ncbi:MAG: hypothetical protein GXO44_05770, partial [Deferribacteres bacterium]|nr:hypothetical protein [Deferribacteres bacterium]